MLSVTEKNWLKKRIVRYENSIAHFYVDTVGKVTIGEGHQVKTLSSIQTLDFRRKSDGVKATAQEIKEDYDKVLSIYKAEELKLQTKDDIVNLSASSYSVYTKLKISQNVIDQLTTKHLNESRHELISLYGAAKFPNFPSIVKYALFDMIFNLGLPKLIKLFPKFNKAIKANNWAEAAKQSHRLDISEDRNIYVHDLLIKAARSAKAKKALLLAGAKKCKDLEEIQSIQFHLSFQEQRDLIGKRILNSRYIDTN